MRTLAVVLTALAVLAGACTDYVGDELRAGDYPRANAVQFEEVAALASDPPPPPEPSDPATLGVGACFDDLDDPPLAAFRRGETVGVVACAQPHRYELYSTPSLAEQADEPWPGEAEVEERADLACVESFEEFVGITWAESTLDYLHLAPTEDRWNGGDPTARCAAFDLGLVTLVGSLENSRR